MTWRKDLQREVTKTVIKSVTTEVIEGKPVFRENAELVVIGNVSEERAVKLAVKEFGTGTAVVSAEANTQKYKMPLDQFIELATLVTDEDDSEQAE